MRRWADPRPAIPRAAHKVTSSPNWPSIRRAYLAMYPLCRVCGEERAELVQHHLHTREQLLADGARAPDAPANLRGLCAFCYFTA